MAHNSNIYFNCPYDEAYRPILKALVFLCVHLEYNPLITGTDNSLKSRIDRIAKNIKNAKYAIHDLSRMKSSRENELARFNMPFELGLDVGCKLFGGKKFKDKCAIILDEKEYRYRKALSNISGYDIEIHGASPEIAVRKVRNWIYHLKGETVMQSANKIWQDYNQFLADFYIIAKNYNLSKADIDEMPWAEYCNYIRYWKKGREEKPI